MRAEIDAIRASGARWHGSNPTICWSVTHDVLRAPLPGRTPASQARVQSLTQGPRVAPQAGARYLCRGNNALVTDLRPPSDDVGTTFRPVASFQTPVATPLGATVSRGS